MYSSNNDNILDFATATGKLPPQNLEAEEVILGGILLDPGAIARVRDFLKPCHFYLSSHGRIYDAMVKLNLQEKPTDLLSVISYLADNSLLDLIGGRNKMVSFVDRTVSAANIDHLAYLIIEKWKRRQLGTLATLANELQHKSHEEVPLEEAFKQLQDLIFSLQDGAVGGGAAHIAEILITLSDDIVERNKGEKLPGIPTGFFDLDAMLSSGFNRGDLIILAGRPSMGKSAFGAQIAFNVANLYRLPVIIFSLEMSKMQVAMRSLASEAGIESNCLKTGRISQSQWEPLSRAIGSLSELPIFIDDRPDPSLNYIEGQCRKVMAQQGTELGLIVVDYLQLMDGGESGGNRNHEISQMTRGLKRLAMKLATPIVCLSQLSRGVEARSDKRPMLSDLRDSGAIEQDCDKAFMMYRDDYYNAQSVDRGICEIIMAKHRDGATGTVKLLFDPQFTRFKNLARPVNGGW